MTVTRNRRLRSNPSGALQINDAVEVKISELGFFGSWHPAKIIARKSKQCLVKYDHLLCDDNTGHLSEYVDISHIGRDSEDSSIACGRIRPTPPKIDLSTRLQYSMCVDAYFQDAWWEGVVYDHEDTAGVWTVLFPELGDEHVISTGNLRLTQDWSEATGEWSLRGKWLFLDTFQEFQQDYVAPVSIRQMWYDLRQSKEFNRVKEWTFQGKDVWKELILEVLNANLQLTANEFLSKTNLSLDLVVRDKSMYTIDHVHSCKEVDAAVFAENLCPADSTELNVLFPSNVQGVLDQSDTLFLTSSVHEKDCGSTSAKPARKPLCSSRVSITWQPIDIRAEEDHKSLADFLRSSKKDRCLETKVRQHLLFLGWKIDKVEAGNRTRYTDPDGKHYNSLVKVRKYVDKILLENSPSGVKDTNGNASPSPSSDCLNTSSLEIVRGKSSGGAKDISKNASPSFSSECPNTSALESAEFLDSRVCPAAITEYLMLDVRLESIKNKIKQVLVRNARHQLSSMGWKIRYVTVKQGKQEARYLSPEQKKTYKSLRSACKAVCNAATPNSSFLINSQISMLEQPMEFIQQKSTRSANPRFLKRKRSHLLHDRQPKSSIQRRSKVNDAEIGFANEPMDMKNCNKLRKLSSRAVPKKRKVRSDLGGKTQGCPDDVNKSTRFLRSSKRARQVIAPSNSLHNPRTVLSWLIDKNIVLPREKVSYLGKDNSVMAVGKVTRDGIKCGCCQKVLSLADFEFHAKSTYHQPAANIFLEDGRSLVKCQMEVLDDSMRSFKTKIGCRKKRNVSLSANDHICSVCHYGGELLLCDKCPSAFHANCLNLQGVPEGDWFCPSCCCAICGSSKPADNTECTSEEDTFSCDQCERLFHVSCLQGRGGINLNSCPKGKWFCCRPCVKVHKGLQKLERKTIPLGHDDLTWTLIKPMQYEDADGLNEAHANIMAENHTKISLALEVLHECFEPVIEPRTNRDLVEDVVFARGSELKRLNFTGFYTILLEKNDELVSAATVRIYGGKVAEVPLVGTRFHYRRLGLCRILMNELEKRVAELGVERLVLPAVPSVLNTWTGSFGFSEMTPTERSEFLAYTFLDFQDTVMCHKLLKNSPLIPLSIPRGCNHKVREIVDEHESNIDHDSRNAISVVYHTAQIEGSDSIDQGHEDIPKDNKDSGGKNPSTEAVMVPLISSDQNCSTTENNCEATERQDHPVADMNTQNSKGEIIQYKRKKPLSGPVPGSNHPKAELTTAG